MKKQTKKFAKIALLTLMTVALLSVSCFAVNTEANATINDLANPVISLINSLMAPLLAIVGALGALYCVILGVKYAKAEEPQDREKAKQHLKNAIIGFVLIFVLLLALKILMPVLSNWVSANTLKP